MTWTGELLPAGHPDRDALREPELIDWITACQAADLFAANGIEVRP
jgi:hypothetical protein